MAVIGADAAGATALEEESVAAGGGEPEPEPIPELEEEVETFALSNERPSPPAVEDTVNEAGTPAALFGVPAMADTLAPDAVAPFAFPPRG